MKFTKKAINKVDNIWYKLEASYKGSEIHLGLMLDEIWRDAENRNDLRNMVKYCWSMWEFYEIEEENYWKKCIKERFELEV